MTCDIPHCVCVMIHPASTDQESESDTPWWLTGPPTHHSPHVQHPHWNRKFHPPKVPPTTPTHPSTHTLTPTHTLRAMPRTSVAPCPNARLMRAKLLRTTLRPRLLLGSRGSMMFRQRTMKPLPPPLSALLLVISAVKRARESARRLSHCSSVCCGASAASTAAHDTTEHDKRPRQSKAGESWPQALEGCCAALHTPHSAQAFAQP
jgi:hypothetical protein